MRCRLTGPVCLTFLSLFMASLGRVAMAEDRPNLVVILCDDLGYGDLQCYGHPHIKTPHLDQLASGGIRFTDFYSAAPVCSPSRVGLLTGRSPNRAGVYDWIPEARGPRKDHREKVHMRASEVTLPHLLKQAGYQTCMAGKWHCNSQFNQPTQPQPGDFGFDHWLATQNNAAPSHRHPDNFVRNGKPIGATQSYSCQFVVDEALRWLANTDAEMPFFLFVPFHEPHEPVASPPELVEQYTSLARDEDEAHYFANVANVDAAVGRLLEGLDRTQRRDNTLVIFTSDNGPETLDRYPGARRSYGTPGPLRGMKLHTTEAGFRVAGIMNWPARIEAGRTVSTPVSSLDFLPTFCELAKVDPPSDRVLDGTSFLPVLEGRPIDRQRPLLWAYYNAINEARVAMRHGKWKVLAKLDGGQLDKFQNVTTDSMPRVRDAKLTDIEIYDLSVDLHEDKNLVNSDPQRARQLTELVRQQYRELLADSHAWD